MSGQILHVFTDQIILYHVLNKLYVMIRLSDTNEREGRSGF